MVDARPESGAAAPLHTAARRVRVALVSNAPAPYRVPALRMLAQCPDVALEVVYCAPPHIDTSLSATDHGFEPRYLGGRYVALDRRFLHADGRVVTLLRRLDPQVVITCGFIPTFLAAFAWARLTRRAHVVFIDGTLQSESSLSAAHRAVRRFVFAHSCAFVGASEGSSRLFAAYGVQPSRIFKAPLAIDNARFRIHPQPERTVDLLFSGRLIAHKSPLFALEVAAGVAQRLGRRVSIDFLGSGELLQELQARALALNTWVQARFLGHLAQAELPDRYARAKVFLFPTRMDTWGVVANEAAAAGLPIVVSPHAGVAGELVRDGQEGRILPLDLPTWTDAVATLLSDASQHRRMADAAQAAVSAYTFEAAASQLRLAILHAGGHADS